MDLVEVEVRFQLMGLWAGEGSMSLLAELGMEFGDAVRQDDQAYAPEGWDYGQSKIGVTFARLRTEGERHLFTVKRPVTDSQTCLEHECEVSDRAAMDAAICLMGYRPTVRIVKNRRSTRIDDQVLLCLDEVEDVGWFVELEALASPGDDHAGLRVHLEGVAETLRLAMEQCPETYDSLVRAARPPLAANLRQQPRDPTIA